MDPPLFERLPIQTCATNSVMIEHWGTQVVHIPVTDMKHVEEFLKPERSRQRHQQLVGNINDDDYDSLSSFEEGGEAGVSQKHPSRPQDARQEGSRIAYWIPAMKEFLIEEKQRGHLRTYVHKAIVIEKTVSVSYWRVVTNQHGDHQHVVIKSMSWEHVINNNVSEDILTEIDALQYLSNVIEGNTGQSHVLTANTIMGDVSQVYIVMPYCENGDILERVFKSNQIGRLGRPCLTEAESRHWFKQMLTGLRTLQTARLCHRDISPENFVILDDATLVIDFGMCLRIPYTEDGTRRHLISGRRACGKLPHMAPEILHQLPFDGHAVDLYSLGTVLLFMLTGVRLVSEHRYHTRELVNVRWGMSEDAADLLRKMLKVDPIERLTLDGIRAHPFLNA